MQEKASIACLDAFKHSYNLLIYAVCGAGKTEIVYDVIIKALNEKKLVCFTTPRKDVVCELVPRFKRDFKNVHIIALYAGSIDKGKLGNLYVSTTHQLINYYHYFDLIIFDEVDAFPYYNNKFLEGLINKSKKINAPIIYLTATPTSELKKAIQANKLKYFLIPARFHKYPIPIPKLVITNNTNKNLNKSMLPKQILNWLKIKKKINKQVFIFVPSINHGEKIESILKVEYNCKFVHAQMRERKRIIEDFRQNKLQFIITTTILERGVTVSNVDVCIINADDDIFDERSIVQIVGRAGRDKRYPYADVVLFADYNTNSIKSSINHVKEMNYISYKNKLIRSVK